MIYSICFQKIIEEIARAPRREESRLYVWVVDSVDEVRGLVALRPLIPSILSLPLFSLIINPPGIQMYVSYLSSLKWLYSCSKVLKLLYSNLSPTIIRSISDSSRGDIRQCCLKCWMYGKDILNPNKLNLLLQQSEEDSFYGMFHLIKKLLLAKRHPTGELENDFDLLFINNHINLHETTSYLHTNLPEYTTSIEDLADLYDCMTISENMGSIQPSRSSRSIQQFDEKGNESFQAIVDRLRFNFLSLSIAVINQHPSPLSMSFTEVKASKLPLVNNQIGFNRHCLRAILDRFNIIYSSSISTKTFLLDYISTIDLLFHDDSTSRLPYFLSYSIL